MIHLGQAGCQVGRELWELFCMEHEIQADGTRSCDESPGVADEPHNAFFGETAAGLHVPRAIFLDTDPCSIDDCRKSKFGKIFHPDSLMSYKQDCKNNFFEGRTQAQALCIKDDLMDRVRMAVDLCTNLQGFFVFHSFGGGTGAGIGVDALEALHEQFDKKVIFQPVIYPSADYSSSIVEPYNCVFATAFTKSNVDLSLMLDNQAAYKMCIRNLKIADPDFVHLNRLISQMVSACTTSLRFEAELNASLTEIVTNLVPESQFRYPILSLSPVRHSQRGSHESFTTREIITDLFDEKNLLCDCGTNLKRNRYLASAILLRGVDPNALDADAADGAASVRSGGSRRSGASGGGEGTLPPIQVADVQKAIDGLMNPRGGYRQPLKFLPWLSDGGFKVGIVGVKPAIPDGFMAQSDRQGALLGNTTAVRQLFVRQYTKFLKLFYHKAYVWQFLEANGELDMFYDAQEEVKEIIRNYEDLMMRCVVVEKEQSGTNLTLVGRTGAGAD